MRHLIFASPHTAADLVARTLKRREGVSVSRQDRRPINDEAVYVLRGWGPNTVVHVYVSDRSGTDVRQGEVLSRFAQQIKHMEKLGCDVRWYREKDLHEA